MARNKKVEILSHDGQVLHPITDGDCVIFPDGETLARKLSEQEEVMYTPEVVNSSPMFKVGEGDSSDYSANVLDGAYQEAVLKGQTYVNTIQEPSADVITLPTPFTEYERTQSKTFTEMQDGTFGLNLVGQSYVNCIQEPSEPSYVALGENLEFQNKKVEYTTDGQIKSAMLNGQTLVNLFPKMNNRKMTLNSDFDSLANINQCSFKGQQTHEGAINYTVQDIKPSTTYTIIYEIISNGITNTGGFLLNNVSNSTVFDKEIVIRSSNKPGIYKDTMTSKADLTSTCSALRMQNGYARGSLEIGNIMLIEGDYTSIDIPYFEGMQSVTMTTELENVCSRYNSSVAKNGKTFTVSSAATRSLKLSTAENISSYNFKQNTKYLLQFKITNLNLDGLENVKLYFSESNISEGNALFGDLANAMVRITKNGIHRVVLTTSSIANISGFVIKGLGTEWESTTSTTRKLTISQIMCIEYQNGMENWDLPYFETTQLMKPLKVQSVNKNLFDPRLHGSLTINTDGTFTLNTSDWSKYKVTYNLKPNTTYKLTLTSTQKCWAAIIINGTSYSHNVNNSPFYKEIITDYKGQVELGIYANTEANIGQTISTIQLEEGATSTNYVPHQSKTTSALEPITLRAIGNVKDTLDLSTGEYVQRIGEIIVDGVNAKAKKWVINNEWSETSRRFDLDITGVKRMAGWSGATTIIKSDKINVFDGIGETNPQCNSLYKWDDVIVLYINNSTITTVDEANDWLKQNPIKVQYQLANPITRKISLEYPNLQTYQDITHVQSIAMDGTLIPKIFLSSDISYRAMLKPNTSYNVIVDREVIDSTNQLTVNLGGTTANITANRTVVRTPSTLSNETLTFSGKDNRLAKAMLIEGGTLINGDLPHFDGIGDVKLGRVVENLCMANEMVAGGATVTSTLYTDRIELKITKEGSCVETFELIKQLQNGKKYFVYCPWDCSNSSYVFGAGFKMSYNDNTNFGRQVTGVNNKKYIIFTIDEKEQLNPYTHFTIGFHGSMAVNTTMTIRRPILCEYIDGMENWDWESIGYFTGTRNIGNEFMRIGNKNLFDSNNLVMGSCQYWGKEFYFYVPSDNRATMTELIKVKSGSTLTLKYNSNFNGVIQEYISPSQKTKDTDVGWQIGQHILKLDEKTNYVNIYFRKIDDTQFTTDELNTLKNSIQLEEASSATSYVAHKHNSLHILPNEQIPLTFVQGVIIYGQNSTWESAINNTNTNRIRTQLLDLEPNETYRISCGSTNHSFTILGYDNNLLGKFDSGWTYDEYYFTTTKDVHKYAINVRYKDNSNISTSAIHQVRLEKVTDVTLRSVNGVCDELDLTRGVYVQRIDEVILNSIENNKIQPYSIGGDNKHFVQVRIINKKDGNKHAIYHNEKLMNYNFGSLGFAGSNPSSNKIMITDDKNIRFTFSGGNNLDLNKELETLKKHPITVQYVLETPIEHKIHIPMKNESNQTIAKPNGVFTLPLMYSETNHIDINSQIYPKVQSRDYISYPVIANNNQVHTVFHNKLGTGNLTVNLCGTSVTSADGTSKCTITTPSTISQYELRLSGARNKVSNVCVFSGDYMNVNVPYVQGMMNAVNPTVKNIGKNLFDGVVKNGEGWWNGKVDPVAKFRRSVNLTPVKPNTEYSYKLANGRGVNFMAHGKDGEFLRYMGWFTSNITKFTTPSDCYYIHWYNDIDDFTDFYIEESPTPSQYEPYKENICEPHSEDIITLRSLPSGVRDELNLQTGEYIQRIGEIIFDGSSDENWRRSSNSYPNNIVRFDIDVASLVQTTTVASGIITICDKYNSVGDISQGIEILSHNTKSTIVLGINSSKLYDTTVDGLKQYLQQNPITVQYELATPIVKQVDINNFPHSYKDGHVVIESNDPSTNVTAQMTYRCVTNRSGQIQEHTEQVEKQERQINELETLILENIRLSQNRSQNFLTSLISTLEIEEE